MEKLISSRIEELLLVTSEPISAPQIARRLDVTVDSVYSAVKRLVASRTIVAQPIDDVTKGYIWRGKSTSPRATGRQVQVMSGVYLGHELRPFDGRPNCNQHENYGSRMGNIVTKRDGDIEDLTKTQQKEKK